jgi:endonuclease G, mitochondrial
MECRTFEIPRQLWEAHRQALATYRGCPTLTGLDVGFKFTNGKRLDDIAVRFLVERKLPMDQVPEACQVPALLAGVPTDVIEPPPPREPADFPRDFNVRHDPVQPGLSISKNVGSLGGTLGAIVFNERGEPGILSSAHVLAGGTVPWVVQPALSPRWWDDSFAEVTSVDAPGDACVARFKYHPHRDYRPEQFLSNAFVQTARAVRLGECLEKAGCATGVTQGRVDGIGIYFLDLDGEGRKPKEGFHLIAIDGEDPTHQISDNGDSGAVWYANGNGNLAEGIGLHIAGDLSNADPEHAIACHLAGILDRLGVSLTPPAPRR